MAFTWSEYQQDIFADAKTGKGHTGVCARAGAAKTTSLLQALEHMPSSATTLLTSFSKDIVKELRTKAPWGADVSTLHSLGYKAICEQRPDTKLSRTRTRDLVDELYAGDQLAWAQKKAITQAVSYAKCLGLEKPKDLEEAVLKFGIDTELPSIFMMKAGTKDSMTAFVAVVQRVLTRSKTIDDGLVDFDDMIWLPIVLDLPVTQYDRVLCDEAQDMNATQTELAMKAVAKGGRVTFAGDDRQSLYAFRGAAHDAFNNLAQRLKAKILSLPISYRCAKEVVREAQKIVPDIEWAPNAKDGLVKDVRKPFMMNEAGPGDFILSRTNAPLIGICFGFLADGRSAAIQGRNIGEQLIEFVEKANRKVNGESLQALLDYVDDWTAKEVKKLRKADPDADTSLLTDRKACLHVLAEHVNNANDLKYKLETLFTDGDNQTRITLSTVHRAKGMERDRVFMLDDTFWLKKAPEVEEANIFYVAVTRARESLYHVKMPKEDLYGNE